MRQFLSRQFEKIPDSPKRFVLRRPFVSYLLASTLLGSALQFIPDGVSRPLDEHMQAENLPTLKNYFSANNIRVYHRNSPLQTAHVSIFSQRLRFSETTDKRLVSEFAKYALTPFDVVAYTVIMTATNSMPDPLNAFSITTRGPHDLRVCYIKPPARSSAKKIINTFLDLNVDNYSFGIDDKTISDGLYTYIMAHEARHCDQQFGTFKHKLMNEADADIYGLRVIRAVTEDKAAADTLFELVAHMRIFSSVMKGGSSHGTTKILEHGEQTPVQSIAAAHDYKNLHLVLKAIEAHNRTAGRTNDMKMDQAEFFYHAATRLAENPQFKSSDDLYAAVLRFVEAVEYFDKITQGKILKHPRGSVRIDTSILNEKYVPAPDKIGGFSGQQAVNISHR